MEITKTVIFMGTFCKEFPKHQRHLKLRRRLPRISLSWWHMWSRAAEASVGS
jgi:hypothetical protein